MCEGYKWLDGYFFGVEDLWYYFEDVVSNEKLIFLGLLLFLLVDGKGLLFEVIDDMMVWFIWDKFNLLFLLEFVKLRLFFIYWLVYYFKQFYEKYGDFDFIVVEVVKVKVCSWVLLYVKKDDMYNVCNIELLFFQLWVRKCDDSDLCFILECNFYYYWVDMVGQQLLYIDQVVMIVVDGKLILVKVQVGEVNLQVCNFSFVDIIVLKKGEKLNDYVMVLWFNIKGFEIIIMLNLMVKDFVWWELLCDKWFWYVLLFGIDCNLVNWVLFFGFGMFGNDMVLSVSLFYKVYYMMEWVQYDFEVVNKLLDEIGLIECNSMGI